MNKYPKYGEKSDEVKKVQLALNEAGMIPRLAPDGMYWLLTKAAIRHFQLKNFLPITGALDEATWNKLFPMPKIREISQRGLQLIERFEGIKLKAYMDTGGVPTIGIGTTRYPNGTRVKMGDEITKAEAYENLRHDVQGACKDVDDLTIDSINQYQFDALVSFVYNCGRGGYSGSTLRKWVNNSPSSPKIKDAFLMWRFDNGKEIKGLLNRRLAEAELYFS